MPTVKVCKRNGCFTTPWPYGDGGAGGLNGLDESQTVPEAPVPDIPASPRQAPPVPPMPAMPAVPSLPPPPNGVVLPPLNGSGSRQEAGAGESRMTLMSPVGANEDDETDWIVVLAIALVAEIALLWGAACITLWRRRVALERAASRTGRDGPAAG